MHCPEPKIGAYCLNDGREVCLAKCAPEKKFRHFEPVPLEPWEFPPEQPPMREMVDQPAAARLAIMWIVNHYHAKEIERSARPLYGEPVAPEVSLNHRKVR
jgi:hypothetical protein